MASTYISRTPSSNGSSTTWTYSVWVKRAANISADQRILSNGNQQASGSQDTAIIFLTDDTIRFDVYDNGTTRGNLDTKRKFRDLNAWYHLVFVWNTTSSTSTMNGSPTDRMQIWVNGVQETEFTGHTGGVPTIPAQNAPDPNTNSTSYPMRIGTRATNQYFNGSLSHANFIDGTVYDASAFGEFDANGVWKIKTSPSVTYGTNGFFVLKDGNSVTDQSGNGNNFTVGGGTLTNTEDNPSNVFATLNTLASSSTPIFGNGNTYVECNSLNSWNQGVPATLVMPSGGKFYWEVKNEDATYPNYFVPGFMNANYYSNLITGSGLPGNVYDTNNGFTNNLQGGGDNNNYQIRRAGSTATTISDTFLNGDILSFAVDLVNRKAWLGKNGTWLNSGNPSNGTNETWGTSDIDANTDYVPTIHYYYTAKGSVNFGNGYFKTTAVASAGTNASGIGIFEYDVPTGFTALSTKGLNL